MFYKAYFGGEVRCDVELGEKYNPEELICGGCSGAKVSQKLKFWLHINLLFLFSAVPKTRNRFFGI
jgi:hypothetical protein